VRAAAARLAVGREVMPAGRAHYNQLHIDAKTNAFLASTHAAAMQAVQAALQAAGTARGRHSRRGVQQAAGSLGRACSLGSDASQPLKPLLYTESLCFLR